MPTAKALGLSDLLYDLVAAVVKSGPSSRDRDVITARILARYHAELAVRDVIISDLRAEVTDLEDRLAALRGQR